MNIGFDLDGVIAARPRIFKLNHVKGRYRTAVAVWEQWFWRIVMTVRKPAYQFLPAVMELKRNGNRLFLISGRLAFLEDVTLWWLTKYDLRELFEEVFINVRNEQPHFYKERLIKQYKIEEYYEDEIFAASYIKEKTKARVYLVIANGDEVRLLQDGV